MDVLTDPANTRDQLDGKRWMPLVVTAELSEPVIYYGDGMHLDGLLAYSAFRVYARHNGLDGIPHITEPWVVDFDLPLCRWTAPAPEETDSRLLTADGQAWGWCASAVQLPDDAPRRSVALRKMPATDEMARYTDSPSVTLGAGALKAADLVFPAVLTRQLVWYAAGDKNKVRRLLKHITHVGKKTAHGYGRVQRWSVRQADDDWSTDRAGVLMRRMPATVRPQAHHHRMAVRPPYHHPSRVMLTVEAGQ